LPVRPAEIYQNIKKLAIHYIHEVQKRDEAGGLIRTIAKVNKGLTYLLILLDIGPNLIHILD